MIVCHCHAVNDGAIRQLINDDLNSVAQIGALCGAGRDCGGCVGTIRKILSSHSTAAVALP